MSLYLLAPEVSLSILAVVVILLDLGIRRKGWLAAISAVGLLIPAGFTLALWGERGTSFFGTLVVDDFSLFFKFLFLGIAALVILGSQDYVAKFQRFQGEYYALILFSTVGLMLLAATKELISIYIALELTALSLAVLVALLKDAKSGEAAIKFLLLSAISSAILLYGMALLYGLTGSTKLDVIANAIRSQGLGSSQALLLGIVLVAAGFGFKIAMVPFQMWVPDVYEGAPTPVTAYLSVASKAAGFAVILRIFYSAFGSQQPDWRTLFAVLAAVSMTLGNLVAVPQNNIKRMLGYSTIAHAGYLLVGLAALTSLIPGGRPLGIGSVLFYLGAYGVTNLGAFFAIIAISTRLGSDQINDYAGVARRAPLLALALAIALLSLTGIPPTAVFWAKVYIFNAAIQSNLAWLAVVGVLNSVLSAYYYLRVVKVMYLGSPTSEAPIPSSLPVRAALVITILGILLLGVLPSPLMRVAEVAAASFP